MANLSSNAFNLILAKLDADSNKAADKYVTLHLQLVKFFENQDRGRWQADHIKLAEETLDRVAKKFEEDVVIEKSFQSYVLGVARYVWLEYIRVNPFPSSDPMPDIEAPKSESEFDPDLRLACLRSCLAEIPKDEDERKLILDYYRSDGEKLKERRKSLAVSLGINTNALKVRMTRLREKLKNCIGKCLEKEASRVTK
ncbi:MAG TPA: hypothetical protein VF648_02270 [Pyrinomonadaceae bacterium]|jgi:DNA-directed RNA polymerase specialized sigma24 family protein